MLEFAGKSDRPPFWAIRNDQWKYVELNTGERELYDLVNDRYELQNQAGNPDLAELQAGLAAELLTLRTEPPHAMLPRVSISDAGNPEGDAGTTTLTFTVSLNDPGQDPVTVSYATVDGSATSPDDHETATGQVTFSPGDTMKDVTVAVVGDEVEEGDETFTPELSDPTGASIGDGTGVGTITEDDAVIPPALSIGDATVDEGDGRTVAATFVVSLFPTSPDPVTVSWATADGTAAAPDDYLPTPAS